MPFVFRELHHGPSILEILVDLFRKKLRCLYAFQRCRARPKSAARLLLWSYRVHLCAMLYYCVVVVVGSRSTLSFPTRAGFTVTIRPACISCTVPLARFPSLSRPFLSKYLFVFLLPMSILTASCRWGVPGFSSVLRGPRWGCYHRIMYYKCFRARAFGDPFLNATRLVDL